MRVPEVDTPALVVDLDRLDANLTRMAALATAAGLDLVPHAKTHKSPPLARRQLAYGAAGLTVATLDEAVMLADAGCGPLFIAYPLWAGGPRERVLRDLHGRGGLRVGVDSAEGADLLAAATRGAPTALPVMIEVDCGARRTGIRPDAVRALAEHCLRRGLDVMGAFAHPGHAYQGRDRVAGAAADERAALSEAGAALTALLDRPPVLSGGSTPTAVTGMNGPLTEVRPGTYVFGDRQQMELTGLPADQVALVVAARVVSTPRPGEAVLDAGSKALSSDRPKWLRGHGWVAEAPEATVDALTEEHAVISGLRRPLAVGDQVSVVPNHVCTAVNLAGELVVVSAGEVVDTWPVRSRRAGSHSGLGRV